MADIREVNCILFVGAGASVPLGYQTTDQFIDEVKKMSLTTAEREQRKQQQIKAVLASEKKINFIS